MTLLAFWFPLSAIALALYALANLIGRTRENTRNRLTKRNGAETGSFGFQHAAGNTAKMEV